MTERTPERVYCLPAAALPEPDDGVLPLDPTLYQRLAGEGRFLPRDAVETDERWRQIIPYAVVTHRNRVMLTERLGAGNETRLHGKLSLGLGGHINPGSHPNARDVLEGGLATELAEELHLGAYRADALGLIHAADDPVSRVHTGLLYRVTSADPPRIRETHKLAGRMARWDEIDQVYERLETWSQRAYTFLAKGR